MNVDACTSLPITTAMSRLDLRIGVRLPGPLRRAGLPRPEPAASGTGRGGTSAAASIREWRSDLLRAGVSESVAAKAYRLLRGVLATAVEEDKILLTNPCRIRGAGDEHARERPVLTVAQVFELAQLLGRRSFGNVRKLSTGGPDAPQQLQQDVSLAARRAGNRR